jgi:hypothetical protein
MQAFKCEMDMSQIVKSRGSVHLTFVALKYQQFLLWMTYLFAIRVEVFPTSIILHFFVFLGLPSEINDS